MNTHLLRRALISAVSTAAYVLLFAFTVNNASRWFGYGPDGWLGMSLALMLFIVSASVTGAFVLLKPILLYIEGKKKEAIQLFAYTVAILAVIAIIVAAAIISRAPSGIGGWLTFNDPKTGMSFQYPQNLSTTYIRTVDWPPMLQIVDQAYACHPGGDESQPAGLTQKRTVDDNREYCVTKESQGAAGSIYTMYAYAAPYKNKTAILTFSLRSPQCGNYGDAQKAACQGERETFDLDSVISKIMLTLRSNN